MQRTVITYYCDRCGKVVENKNSQCLDLISVRSYTSEGQEYCQAFVVCIKVESTDICNLCNDCYADIGKAMITAAETDTRR